MLTTTYTTRQISTPEVTAANNYHLPIGYLRAFVTVLVLAFHSVLAYHPDAPPPATSLLARPLWWTAFPIVDPQRWTSVRLFVAFNDTFFMSLMFFLSGLFVWRSLQRKRAGAFLRDRSLRLGVPFLVAALLLAPLAYFPAYLQTTGPHTLTGYAHRWLALGEWPAGPAWFVWVLLAFDALAAVVFSVAQPTASLLLERLGARRPLSFFLWLLAASAAAYIPLLLLAGPAKWTDFGPFYFQTSRILHYAVYFFAGIAVGAFGLSRGLLDTTGKLARRWLLWCLWALIAFGISGTASILALMNYRHAPYTWGVIAGSGFVLSCAASCFAMLALFLRFVRTRRRLPDMLSQNAYGLYLVHYVFVSWSQWALLQTFWPAACKGTLAFLAVLVLSLATASALRRLPAVARLI